MPFILETTCACPIILAAPLILAAPPPNGFFMGHLGHENLDSRRAAGSASLTPVNAGASRGTGGASTSRGRHCAPPTTTPTPSGSVVCSPPCGSPCRITLKSTRFRPAGHRPGPFRNCWPRPGVRGERACRYKRYCSVAARRGWGKRRTGKQSRSGSDLSIRPVSRRMRAGLGSFGNAACGRGFEPLTAKRPLARRRPGSRPRTPTPTSSSEPVRRFPANRPGRSAPFALPRPQASRRRLRHCSRYRATVGFA